MFLTHVKDKFCSKLHNQVNVFSTLRKKISMAPKWEIKLDHDSTSCFFKGDLSCNIHEKRSVLHIRNLNKNRSSIFPLSFWSALGNQLGFEQVLP